MLDWHIKNEHNRPIKQTQKCIKNYTNNCPTQILHHKRLSKSQYWKRYTIEMKSRRNYQLENAVMQVSETLQNWDKCVRWRFASTLLYPVLYAAFWKWSCGMESRSEKIVYYTLEMQNNLSNQIRSPFLLNSCSWCNLSNTAVDWFYDYETDARE